MGGGNCLFGTESVYRGKYSIVEVASDAVKTELPDMGIWESGTLNAGTRCFDLLCTGKCNLMTSSLKLNVESSDKIPNFFTKNSEGKIVFSTPSPMSVITTPKGHGTWIQIELKTINGVSSDSLSGIARHICLGIKKRSEMDYFDVIHAGKLTSEYVDLFDTDAVELVPLLSKTEVTGSSYELVKPGEEITPSDFGLTGTSFDFGSVYRVNIKDCGAWIERECNLGTLDTESGYWANYGSLGVGPILGQEGDQLVAVKTNGILARSTDGIFWYDIGDIEETLHVGPEYGNGVWCVANGYVHSYSIGRSIDGGITWVNTNEVTACQVLVFGNDIFMIVDKEYFLDNEKPYSNVYISTDAETWTEVGVIPRDSTERPHCILIYGNNKWICGTWEGTIYQSKDGREWKHIGEISQTVKTYWFGGCYANGYFYVVNCANYRVMRSATGENWEEVTRLSNQCAGVAYYRNKLFTVNYGGTTCDIGIPNS